MTDQELAMRLTGALDDRIDRASSAPVSRETLNRMPSADTLTTPTVQAVPVKQIRWKSAVAAVLVLGMLGGIGLAVSKLMDRATHPQTGESGNSEVAQTTAHLEMQNTEPQPDTDPTLPQLSYANRTIQITGTSGYDRLDLSPYLDNASMIKVEDDRFQFSASIYTLRDMGIFDDLAADLPSCLDRMDRSIDYMANYFAAVAPNEEIAAQTRKPVKISMDRIINYRNYDEYIGLSLGQDGFYRLSMLYAYALLNPEDLNWYAYGYVFWFYHYQDPYRFRLLYHFLSQDSDNPYIPAYHRAGGIGECTSDSKEYTPDDIKLLYDVIAWYNLIHGGDWRGSRYAPTPTKEFSNFTGDPALEGNDLCLDEAISLINYLAEQYGHDKVAAYCFETCSFEEAFGTDFATARAAWEQSLLERFGDGSEEP